MKILIAKDYEIHGFYVVEKNIESITISEFEKRAKDIDKEYHPVRYIFLEDNEQNILALYRSNKITLNKLEPEILEKKVKDGITSKKSKR